MSVSIYDCKLQQTLIEMALNKHSYYISNFISNFGVVFFNGYFPRLGKLSWMQNPWLVDWDVIFIQLARYLQQKIGPKKFENCDQLKLGGERFLCISSFSKPAKLHVSHQGMCLGNLLYNGTNDTTKPSYLNLHHEHYCFMSEDSLGKSWV